MEVLNELLRVGINATRKRVEGSERTPVLAPLQIVVQRVQHGKHPSCQDVCWKPSDLYRVPAD
jgi:hypothetical protein